MPIDPNQAAFFLNPLEQMQRMDVAAERRGPELDRLKALARFDTTRANELEDEAKADEVLRKEFANMPRDPKQPASSMLSAMAQRAAAINPTAATKWFNLALTAANREQQAESADALAFARTQRGKLLEQQRWGQVVAAVNTPGDLPNAVMELRQQGMPAEDIKRFEEIAKSPGGIEYLKRRVLTPKEQMTDQNADADRALRASIAARAAKLSEWGLRIRDFTASVNATREAAGKKAGGGKLGMTAPTKGELEQVLKALEAEEDLVDSFKGNAADLAAFASDIAGEAKALIASRPAGQLSFPEARVLVFEKLKGRIEQTPTTLGKVLGAVGLDGPTRAGYKPLTGKREASAATEITGKADYDKLPKGAKYLWKGKEYTKE